MTKHSDNILRIKDDIIMIINYEFNQLIISRENNPNVLQKYNFPDGIRIKDVEQVKSGVINSCLTKK